MAENSKIEWCDHTWNPWIGCTKVSDGCKHCYAETLMDKRWQKVRWGPQGKRLRTSEAYWRMPLSWNKTKLCECPACGWRGERNRTCPACKRADPQPTRARVFCASLADVFENRAGIDALNYWRAQLWYLIEQTPNLDWLPLTKRPENIEGMIPESWAWGNMPRNLWLGVSAEDQDTFEERWDVLDSFAHCYHPSVVFLSLEPLLGPIDIEAALTEIDLGDEEHTWWTRTLSWVIVGGESGPGARPFDLSWALDLVNQCRGEEVPVFMKQLGSCPIDGPAGYKTGYPISGKGGDPNEWPEALRVRQFPHPENLLRETP